MTKGTHMDNQDLDRLLQQSLSGDLPGRVFRARALLDSTAALGRRRRIAATWRMGGLSAAAVLIATVSFLVGRCSMPSAVFRQGDQPVVASRAGTVVVPGEVVVWLNAARFFGRLGMADRASRAYERASELLPREAKVASEGAERLLVAVDAGQERPDRAGTPERAQTAESNKWIIAQSWRD